jgi:hypothetical protein
VIKEGVYLPDHFCSDLAYCNWLLFAVNAVEGLGVTAVLTLILFSLI